MMAMMMMLMVCGCDEGDYDEERWGLGWGYKTKNRAIISAVAKCTAFGHTFTIKIDSNPQNKFLDP